MKKAVTFIGSVFGLLLMAFFIFYFVVGMERFWTMVAGEPDMGAIDFQTVRKTETPNQYLVCPQDYCEEKPDRFSPAFDIPAEQLQEVFDKLVSAKSNVTKVAEDQDVFTERYVARSPFFRFPDTVSVQFFDLEAGQSAIGLYSRSLIGHSDFGANKARVDTWLEELDAEIKALN